MNTFLKAVIAVCAVGIVVVAAIGMLGESAPQASPAASTPAPTTGTSTAPLTLTLAPAADPSTTPPAGAAEPEPTQTDEPGVETSSPAFSIEELTAECDAGEGFGVTALPLGTDWRITERGVYSKSPVTITCVTAGATDGLTYEWKADEGEIEGSGDSIVWTAPGHGAKVLVSVMVRDGSGGEELAALNFRVATCDCVYRRYE